MICVEGYQGVEMVLLKGSKKIGTLSKYIDDLSRNAVIFGIGGVKNDWYYTKPTFSEIWRENCFVVLIPSCVSQMFSYIVDPPPLPGTWSAFPKPPHVDGCETNMLLFEADGLLYVSDNTVIVYPVHVLSQLFPPFSFHNLLGFPPWSEKDRLTINIYRWFIEKFIHFLLVLSHYLGKGIYCCQASGVTEKGGFSPRRGSGGIVICRNGSILVAWASTTMFFMDGPISRLKLIMVRCWQTETRWRRDSCCGGDGTGHKEHCPGGLRPRPSLLPAKISVFCPTARLLIMPPPQKPILYFCILWFFVFFYLFFFTECYFYKYIYSCFKSGVFWFI